MEQNEHKEQKMLLGDANNAVVGLFAVIFIVFVFFRMMYIIFQNNPARHLTDYNNLFGQFALPLKWSEFVKKPWTLLTYMVTNIEYVKIITNGIWVMGMGFLTQSLVGNKHIIPSFVYGALAAGIVLLATNSSSDLMVSGSEYGILSLATTLAVAHKNGSFIKDVPNRVLCIALPVLYAAILLLSASNKINSIAAFVVTIATGVAYGFAIKKNIDAGAPLHDVYQTITGKAKNTRGIIMLLAVVLAIIVFALW